jgi:hypothetical protein
LFVEGIEFELRALCLLGGAMVILEVRSHFLLRLARTAILLFTLIAVAGMTSAYHPA